MGGSQPSLASKMKALADACRARFNTTDHLNVVVNPNTILVAQTFADGTFIDDLDNIDLAQAFDYPENRRAAQAIVDEWKEAQD